MLPFVSVIVPVYNDALRLKRCLNALQAQTYPKKQFEIIVIDNGSNGNLSEIKSFKNVHLGFETKPSQFAARNKGIAVSKGIVLAFTNSNCIPSPQWIENGVKALSADPNYVIIGGNIKFFFKNKKPNIVELYDSLLFLQQKKNVEEKKFALSANLFAYKRIFDEVGLFNEELKSGGDNEWGKRVFDHGYCISYAPATIVNHPARNRLSDILKKARRVTGGHFVREKRAKETSVRFWRANFLNFLFRIKNVFSLTNVKLGIKFRLVIIELLCQCFRMHELMRLRQGKTPKRE